MKVFKRLSLVAAGGFLSFYGWVQLQRGIEVYANHYDQAIYSAGVIALGGFLALLGLIPTSFVNWVVNLQMSAAKRRNRKARHDSEG